MRVTEELVNLIQTLFRELVPDNLLKREGFSQAVGVTPTSFFVSPEEALKDIELFFLRIGREGGVVVFDVTRGFLDGNV